MSVSALPEWKQLLLEKKRREEEERERREKEEEDKLASMPAWKRGIIQRRKAKQESVSDRERDKDMCLLQVELRSPSDGLSDTDSSITVNLESEVSLSPDPDLWLDAEVKPASQVSTETIVPVHENPFFRTQSVWRKGKDVEAGNDLEVKEKEKKSLRSQDCERGRERDLELKIEKFRDLTDGWEKDTGRDWSQGRENNLEASDKDRKHGKDSVKDMFKEQEIFKTRRETEEKETHPSSGSFSSHVPCLRTIRADNIIIIEQDRKRGDLGRGRWREVDRETPEEDQQGKRGMKVDLRGILAGGGSVTEIRASEVLIIKPSGSPEKGREDGEAKRSVDLIRELRTDLCWVRDKEKDKPCGQATVINKDDRRGSSDDGVFVERGGRVSKLLSKFGEHHKPPSRSKSSEHFLNLGRRKYSEDQEDQQAKERKAEGRKELLKSGPKRSFSFSERVAGAAENGLSDKRRPETIHSDQNMSRWTELTGSAKLKQGYTKIIDKDRLRKYEDVKTEDGEEGVTQRIKEVDMWKKQRIEVKKVEPFDGRVANKVADAEGEKGFTVASVKNTEGISFAKRVPIRQDAKSKPERDERLWTAENSPGSSEQHPEPQAGPAEVSHKADIQMTRVQLGEGCDTTAPLEELISARGAPHGHNEQDLTLTESSDLLTELDDSGLHPLLSQQTEELVSKVERIGDTTVYIKERGERACRAAAEVGEMEEKLGKRSVSECMIHNVIPQSPKRVAPVGVPPGPVEIQIPRSVFYVADEMKRKKAACQSGNDPDWEGGQKVERRNSWRIGKPLSRIESLRERIRRGELEKLSQNRVQDGDRSGAAEIRDAHVADDGSAVRGSETERERKAMGQVRAAEGGRGQEEAEQTLATACDIRREVSLSQTSPQLPVSGLGSDDDCEEEASGESPAAAASEPSSDSSQSSEDEDEPLKYVEVTLDRLWGEYESTEEEEEEEDKEFSEEELKRHTSVDSENSISPSPPHPNSLAAMSRIYNLNTVGSRSGLCLRERTVDIPSSVHLVKVKPFIASSQQGDSKGATGEEALGVQTIQQQIEQFQIKEQEALKSRTNTLKDRETKGQQSPKAVFKQQTKESEETKESPQRVLSPTPPFKQTITVTPSFLRGQSPDTSLKPLDCAPTPASSPCSPSPASSPSISPSRTPSPKLFSIKSASGGQVKRGATITITPKKGAASSNARGTTAGVAKAPAHQTAIPEEPAKKKYPAAEEIQVIGGYQNLERSCLVKNKVTPKRGKVCFDEEQLEQVCEYPSETFMLTLSPLPYEREKAERPQAEEGRRSEGEAGGGAVFLKSMKSIGTAAGPPRVRVDESCPR